MNLTLRIALVLPLALAPWVPLAAGARPVQEAPAATVPIPLEPRTIVLVRHAEKSDEGDANDPALSSAGEERAKELARLLAHSGTTRLIATEYRRTRETLAPLAATTGLQVEVRPAPDVEALASEIASAEPGSVTVVCGHSNTLPALAQRLGVPLTGVTEGPRGATLAEDRYDRLFVVHLPPTGSTVRPSALELRYGK
jgi:phosphohistidine phosphatase SixA